MIPTPKMIEAAKAIAEKITKAMENVTVGPWETRQDRDDFEVYPTFEGPPSIGEWTSIATCPGIYDEVEANAAYIALCNPANMRVLLSAFDSLALLPADPVAWQMRQKDVDEGWLPWGFVPEDTAIHYNSLNRTDIEVRPLYAAPVPQPVSVKALLDLSFLHTMPRELLEVVVSQLSEDQLSTLRRFLYPAYPSSAEIEALRVENTALRKIISDCAASLPNGAFIDTACSVEFMQGLPKEISLVCATLQQQEEGNV